MLGIVVKTSKIGESDLRLVVFTAQGIKYIKAKGVLKQGAKLKHCTPLFTIGEFEVVRDILIGGDVLNTPFDFAANYESFIKASSIADSLLRIEFCENGAAALILAIKALNDFDLISYFGNLLEILGYGKEDKRERIINAFNQHMDYSIISL
ncbi:MAG: recombination protein O N-terminal domain-containing protein [Christensenellaceae bacterium]|jgi:hypothetical protein|nr:recombination protein O N-terminal domain-containing protein [Christensenellaceae bacterium]